MGVESSTEDGVVEPSLWMQLSPLSDMAPESAILREAFPLAKLRFGILYIIVWAREKSTCVALASISLPLPF